MADATVTGVVATLTTDAPAGTFAADGIVTGVLATITLDAPAGTVVGYLGLAAYIADDSQKFNIDVTITANLYYDEPVTAPPTPYTTATVRGRRLSLVMPTPTLDSRGRPT